jgi:metallophosphoesterase superfamily enzyme
MQLPPDRAPIDADTILDARLALYHQREKWLAVADLHYGYELSQRAAGALFPLWGMDAISKRLAALLADYRPERLIIAGDFAHDRAGREPALAFLGRLRADAAEMGCEVTVLEGNHDRRTFAPGAAAAFHITEGFCFHHGHGPVPPEAGERIEIVGHHHPAGVLRDGAGLALKLPAFVQGARRWILPAFSPWAAGGGGRFGADSRLWLCSPGRILRPAAA